MIYQWNGVAHLTRQRHIVKMLLLQNFRHFRMSTISDVSRFGIGYRLTFQILPRASRPALESFAKARHTHSLTRDVSAEGPSDLSFFWIKNTVQTGALMTHFDLALMPAFSWHVLAWWGVRKVGSVGKWRGRGSVRLLGAELPLVSCMGIDGHFAETIPNNSSCRT